MNSLNKVTGHCVVCEGNLHNNEKVCVSCQTQYGITK
jgi:predicted nucleic acid-binding Zn ribbon protein